MDKDVVWRVIDDERSRLADLMEDLSDPSGARRRCAGSGRYGGRRTPDAGPHGAALRGGLPDPCRRRLQPDDPRHREQAGPPARARVPATVTQHGRLPPHRAVHHRTRAADRRPLPRPGHRPPIGRPYPMPAAPAVAAADHIWRRSFPFRAQRRLRGSSWWRPTHRGGRVSVSAWRVRSRRSCCWCPAGRPRWPIWAAREPRSSRQLLRPSRSGHDLLVPASGVVM